MLYTNMAYILRLTTQLNLLTLALSNRVNTALCTVVY